MTDNEIIQKATEAVKYGLNADYAVEHLLKIIKDLQADKNALIAGQETLQKCIVEKDAELELSNDEYSALLKKRCRMLRIENEELEARALTATYEIETLYRLLDEYKEILENRCTSGGGWTMLPELPPEDERVFVCCQTKKGVKSVNIAYQSDGIWHGSGSMSGVTAWMPLPELPGEV